MAWTGETRDINGLPLHLTRTGGDKPPLVLLHGITDNGLCWTRVAHELEDDYDVVMPDCRGHGQSHAPETGYTVEALAGDVAGLIQALGLDHPALLGHSMGGETAAVTAARYPDLVRAILLEDPPWRDEGARLSAHDRAMMAAEWRSSIHARHEMSLAELVELAGMENPGWDAAEVGPWAESKRQVNPNVVGYVSSTRPDWRTIAGQIQCPGLLITGDPRQGSIVTADVARTASQVWPLLHVAHIAGAGHSIRRDRFDDYMNVVRDFLRRIYPA